MSGQLRLLWYQASEYHNFATGTHYVGPLRAIWLWDDWLWEEPCSASP